MKPVKETKVNQDLLLRTLSYDKESGELTWKKSHQKVKVGDTAGHLRKDGYVDISINGHKFLAHRVIWCMVEGYWPECEVDHLNRVRSDNRWSNLDHKTQSCNNRNGELRKDSFTKVKGVHKVKGKNRYVARITVNGSRVFLGEFSTITEAANARASAEELYGYSKCIHGKSSAKHFLGVVE